MATALTPVTILTGFLGSGKTTLLKRILTEAHGQKIAVIENEFGQENIDNEILINTTDNIVQLSNGCICCNIRDDLRQTLQELALQKKQGKMHFDRVVIETTGLADPGPVAQTFFMDDGIAEHYLLDSILTLVDAKHAQQQLTEHAQARKQIGFADYLFITKTDLVGALEVQDLQNRLKHMNPRAPQKAVHFGDLSLKEVFDLRGFNLNAKLEIDADFLTPETPGLGPFFQNTNGVHVGHDDDVKSFVFVTDKALDVGKLEEFLGAIVNIYGTRMLRYKGVLWMNKVQKKVIFQGVHQLMASELGPLWGKNETRQSKMVFIGIDLPKDIFLQGMAQCVV